MVENFRYVLSLPQIMRNATVPGAVRALRAHTGGVTVGVIVRIHPIGLVPPPHRLLLHGPMRGGVRKKWKVSLSGVIYYSTELNVKRHTRIHFLCLQIRELSR